MSPTGVAVACLLALSLSAWGQKAPQPPVQEDPLVRQLYRQARQATASVPALLAPGMLSTIARDELRPGHNRSGSNQVALTDFSSAFALALALPSGMGDPVLDPLRAQIKAEVEEDAVAELARHQQEDAALALTRTADVPREPLYSQLIAALAYGHKDSLDRVESLVDECERASGAFPYRGVAAWLRREGGTGLDQMLLVQSGFQWARQETRPSQIEQAMPFLLVAHQKEPELDQELENTIAALLTTLSAQPVTYGGTAHNAVRGLLSVLRMLDPAQAAPWQQLWPQINLSGEMSGGEPRFGNGSIRLGFTPTFSAAVTGVPAQTARIQQFTILVHRAESLRRRDPDRALSRAGLASGMLDQQLWPSVLPLAVRLAALEQQLGDVHDAAALLASCLDEADRQARAVDAQYEDTDAAAMAALAEDPSRVGAPIVAAYSEAARVNFAATAAHAEIAQFTLLKPLVLARVALDGAVAARRRQQLPARP
ncbi:MAG: hypothetical protein ACRD0Y_06060 [Terriglobales bacterium]